ncbi:4a-hydroxytetrahydrobiopterin dehydratase [Paracraurococcus lichenis]|uniref:Putative pterin-4-alpha-carbinolamine dehydratase n=1 Tax=Paracraurococcus lichenis TaxID=3064888 RepID=A0ABT9E7R4_9PROT|nr:4a-hydroxytetrahydrobiopterin dehydratase [Paracraurococcus sp. LOR1-02]MDO9712251.1 4a-hydroxytetrahydrobiopterin dehydratase [Paracraurococcus sp. LOR1-02]
MAWMAAGHPTDTVPGDQSVGRQQYGEHIGGKDLHPVPRWRSAADGGRGEGYREQAPDWSLMDDATRIERRFQFKDFREAFAFATGAAELAEAEGHHPDITFGWGYATVSLRTKKIKGLHENDFIMAAKLDRLAADPAAGTARQGN